MRLRSSTAWIAHDMAPGAIRHLVEVRGTVQLLRLVGLGLVFWYERIVFLYASLQCSPWNAESSTDQVFEDKAPSYYQQMPHLVVTILADPQLIDAHSYDYIQRLPWPLSSTVYYIARWAADTYVRKSYQAVVRSGGRAGSDAVVWLGDLLDRGRVALSSAADVERYERATHRFHGLFRERLPTLFLPGNHDVRIPLMQDPKLIQESRDSRERWVQEWGTWHDARHRATWSVNGGRERVLVRPEGGPAVVKVMDDRARSVSPKHDTKASEDLGQSQSFVNARVPIYLNTSSAEPTHELVLVDALDLAGMLPATLPAGSAADADWQLEGRRAFQQTYDFVESLKDPRVQSKQSDIGLSGDLGGRYRDHMRILFSHIPLYRPTGTHCNRKEARHGIVRETEGAIEQGFDQQASYQNTLAQPVTEWLLDHVDPRFSFSGDDHDHCEVQHPPTTTRAESTELTLKAFSMTGGVRRPGYARLGLYLDADTNQARARVVPCLLPDQVAIWTFAYPIALLCVAAALFLDRRYRLFSRLDRQYRDRMAAWRLSLASRTAKAENADPVQTIEDEEWQLVERGERSLASVRGAEPTTDDDEEADGIGSSTPTRAPHILEGRQNRREGALSPASSKRIRYSRPSTALLQTPKRGGTPRLAHTVSSFEARAVRELKLAEATGEAVALRTGMLTELSKVLLGPILLWLWFQLF